MRCAVALTYAATIIVALAAAQAGHPQRSALPSAPWPNLGGADVSYEMPSRSKEITPVLQQDAAWAKAATLLQTITGVGLVTAAWLVTSTLTVSICPSPEAAVCLCRLSALRARVGHQRAPQAAISRSGNKRLRRTLSLATLSATRFNPQIKAFYTRLRGVANPLKSPAVPPPASSCTWPGPWSPKAARTIPPISPGTRLPRRASPSPRRLVPGS